ncbi:DNA repair protein radC [Fusobacterium vincentii ATCC 51190]|uniref:DNA repair protein RadC n=1 Tax=Fusobacterium vincentii TaxID=155615 RepID=A0AAJ1CSI7_FUSVC|nr:DNA repair protein RadC [Fusobacterium vincentii]EJG09446.1 DNA repair protein radC [Fusobacterium vincentii ATCC 51190]MCW0263440.1 DNA repair protein RadC [Fusobacterium vincentii]STO29316.1 DNA repair protein RadC [Fusobacterium vincentii]
MSEKDNQGHRERIKEKFLKNGIDGFAEYEILELLLTYCIPRKDTKPIAKELLNKFKSLDNIFKADFDKLFAIDGLGKNSIAFLKLIGDLPSIIYKDELKNKKLVNKEILKISNKDILLNYLRNKIGYEEKEKFYVIYLSSSNEVIEFEENSVGTLDRSSVYPREIYKKVINLNAKSIILAHNHPSNNITPSKSDIELTNEIAKGLKNFGALLIEHIIITKNSYFSFLEEGLI